MKYNLLLIGLLITCFTSRVNAQSVPSELATLIDDGTYPNIDAIIVQQGDQIIIEDYFNDFDREAMHDTRSSFKSITSLLAGIAIDQGLLKLEDNLGKFFPELAGQSKADITVQNLLEMMSGLACEEFYDIGPECEGDMWESDDWIAYCIGIDLVNTPGTTWSYSSNDPMIMGEVVSRAAGMTIMDFAKENLFDPLDIKDYKWTISPKGRGMTAGSFYMRPLDMLKIAQLVSNKGVFDGDQLVSSQWIKQSTDCQIDLDFSFTGSSRMPNATYHQTTYGFYWYQELLEFGDTKTEVLFASGNGGQYMMVIPDYNAIAVFTGSNYGNW
ncbi:MAG: serine hydrolase domain-containing protein, partial [Bacteroidota bacterium]